MGDEFRDHLLSGESIQWWDRPAQGLVFTSRDSFLIPFSLMWGGFALFWESSVIRGNAPFFFTLWGVPFVLAGLYLMFGRFIADAWLRAHISYALTDRRVLILRQRPFGKFTALTLANLPPVSLSERSDGSGTVTFEQPQAYLRNRGFSGWTPALSNQPQLFRIPDARRVYNKIQELAAQKPTLEGFKTGS